MEGLDLAPIGGPGKKKTKALTAKEVNEKATADGISFSENEFGDAAANTLLRRAEERPDALNFGKYSELNLFEDAGTQGGKRVVRYRKGAPRQYNNDDIKRNVMRHFQEKNPGQEIIFDYAYGGEMESVNPLTPIY